MAWWITAKEIADEHGNPSGRWRMTATSDEDGGGPFGDLTHDHASAEDAEACEACDAFVSMVSGFPSKAAEREMREKAKRADLARLKRKYEGGAS